MAVVTMRQLLGAGVHFGHQTRRWNPKMRRFILGERNGIYLIDLRRTLEGIDAAYGYTRDLVAGGGTILFVGTKKQAQGPIADFAGACGMPYVNQRWLGGMLTNFTTVSSRVQRMRELAAMQAAGDFDAMPKKEALRHSRELEKLERNLGGINGLERLPDAIFVIDTKKEHIAVTEANKLGLPVVAVVDTNCDPDVIDFVIPGNDDAIRSGSLMCRVIADAVAEGRYIAVNRPVEEPKAPEGGRQARAGRGGRGGARSGGAQAATGAETGETGGAKPAAETAAQADAAPASAEAAASSQEAEGAEGATVAEPSPEAPQPSAEAPETPEPSPETPQPSAEAETPQPAEAAAATATETGA